MSWCAAAGAGLAALLASCAPGTLPEPGDARGDGSDGAREGSLEASRADGAEGVDAGLDAAVDAPRVDAQDAARELGPEAAVVDAPPPPPDFDALPWRDVGLGVSFKDTGDARGANVFVGYAGYGVSLAQAQAWVTALYHAWLGSRGVRYVYAVQGPATVTYAAREIQNTRLLANLLPSLTPATHFIAVAGHSSGGWVACELLQQLYEGGLDPAGLTRGRTVYFDLDGVQSCVDATMVANLRRVYFVGAHTDVAPGGWSLNAMYMMQGAMRLGSGGFQSYNASASGCLPGAPMCLHISLVNTHPADPSNGTPSDYADFSRGPVNAWYLENAGADLAP